MTYFFTPNREIKKIPVPEQAFEFMKNMNPQQLVDFLLPNDDDWYVKTSSGNASGNYIAVGLVLSIPVKHSLAYLPI